MKKYLTLTLLLHLAYIGSAQENVPAANAQVKNLKKHLYYLASDELNGRRAGSEGQKRAAAYIAQQLSKSGVAPIGTKAPSPYYQGFALHLAPVQDHFAVTATIKSTSQRVYMLNDMVVLSARGFGDTEVTPYMGPTDAAKGKRSYVPVVEAQSIDEGFAKIEEATKGKVKGTFMLLLPSKKLIEFRKSRFALSNLLLQSTNDAGDTVFTSPFTRSFKAKENEYYSRALPFLERHPALNILLIDEIFLRKLFKNKEQEADSPNAGLRLGETIEFIGRTPADKLTTIGTENVVGLIEGTHKKDEAVILCAHYDHIYQKSLRKTADTDTIYNGADDNASGTSAIMEVARMLAQAKKNGYLPKRTIVVAAFTAEEMGLIGSSYMAENPIIPLSKTRMVVNLDMVGRTNQSHTDTSMYVYPLVLGSTDSTFTHNLNQNAKRAGIDISGKLANSDRMSWTHGSDHASFVKKSIPAISLTTGKHPDYHKPSDEADKISYPRLERITNFAFYTVWQLANE